SIPVNINAGSVMNEPPPASAFCAPAHSAATKRMAKDGMTESTLPQRRGDSSERQVHELRSKKCGPSGPAFWLKENRRSVRERLTLGVATILRLERTDSRDAPLQIGDLIGHGLVRHRSDLQAHDNVR